MEEVREEVARAVEGPGAEVRAEAGPEVAAQGEAAAVGVEAAEGAAGPHR